MDKREDWDKGNKGERRVRKGVWRVFVGIRRIEFYKG